MKKTFSNDNKLECVFTEDGITFSDPKKQIFVPYNLIDSIKLSILGILQVTSHKQIFNFAVDHKDRHEMKEMIKYAIDSKETCNGKAIQEIDKVESNLSKDEQIKELKTLFIQGKISKDEYDLKRKLLKEDN